MAIEPTEWQSAGYIARCFGVPPAWLKLQAGNGVIRTAKLAKAAGNGAMQTRRVYSVSDLRVCLNQLAEREAELQGTRL